ncbi:MAG TPA: hypothetical protein VFN26_03800 [Candidatus Acidoferrum sp.]|nr:hypothetical protein [Candidatus Acidoferrum sp.]
MDLLERYLQSVRTYLPKAQQDDIIKELSENLRSQIEDQESGLGRALNEDELAALLKRHGHPLIVATRYRQSQHLIGPTLFPVYWQVMKIILVIVALGYGIAALVMLAQSDPIFQVLGAAFNFVGAVLPTFAWVTLTFAVLDLGNSKFRLLEKVTKECDEKFDPRTLPPLKSDSPDARPISRSKTAFELFFNVAFLLWWLRVEPIRRLALFVALGPVGLAGKIPFQLGPFWKTIYVPIILLTLVSISQQVVNLIHPHWVKFYGVTRLITQVGGSILLYLLYRAREIFVLAPGAADAAKFTELLRIINLTLHYVFLFTVVIGVFECIKQIRRLVRVRRSHAMSPAL